MYEICSGASHIVGFLLNNLKGAFGTHGRPSARSFIIPPNLYPVVLAILGDTGQRRQRAEGKMKRCSVGPVDILAHGLCVFCSLPQEIGRYQRS